MTVDRSTSPTNRIGSAFPARTAAARYFESLGRFASYGFVPDADNCEWSQIRGRAFAEELDERLGGVSVSVASAPLADWLLSMQKPAAILAAFDQCASQLLDIGRAHKLKIPGDVIVLGVDDDALICEHTRPKLSSVKPDHEQQGYTAAKALDDILRRRKPCGGTTVVCPYVGITERDSTTIVPPAVHLVREAKSYIAAHALERIRVEEVVRHLGVSARLAQLRFSQAIGHSIREELILRRLNEVKRLLAETPYPPRRIARRCGFKSTIVLAHLFRSHEGCSMRAWRAGHASETL